MRVNKNKEKNRLFLKTRQYFITYTVGQENQFPIEQNKADG
jgi:hypothetical protein